MNKYAAEKIAQEYYQLGVQIAVQNSGLTKEANLGNKMKGYDTIADLVRRVSSKTNASTRVPL